MAKSRKRAKNKRQSSKRKTTVRRQRRGADVPGQMRIPGTVHPIDQELIDLAELCLDKSKRRKAAMDSEQTAHENLIKCMHKHNQTEFKHSGLCVELVKVEEKEKVKVRREKESVSVAEAAA